ncbi:tetratricopeptide repeat protein [Bacillus subtilis]|uniref:response regulator aspartate phosphatase n=1 Tax=Bacillus subtilis TaxID=1423 RepID=UPI002DB823A1|nr:tetratricopeptide repeat protein [Bacillus subtilis]MEC3619277.1 tetratricopeptide repeat protein [Bacillus subtilis]MEC3634784.1 tetratricopeptide repeat protein [Bacillus subtilis]MEC3643410.1 tetratricopeptide repeat protein [Bacillus subtilis]MEC3646442.1 tetratricopeptide repeat protein [Bacillus subtilis]MEC3696770.1 tetratricopeptide repeat protein [Bacillus subtilis]
MSVSDLVPYHYVTTDINHWYVVIKQGRVEKAKEMKQKVEKEFDMMEKNEKVAVYLQLLKLRHEIMLSYLEPDSVKNIDGVYADLKKTRENMAPESLTNTIEFYYHFFTGMYHFRTRDLVIALTYYREAEKYLDLLDKNANTDKAEFYFKMSEVYYYMKETHFSMNYAQRAYSIFKEQKDAQGNLTYGKEMVQCQFVIFGNWLDKMCYEDALETAEKALNDAIKIGEQHLIGSAHFNVGLCYNNLEELDNAEKHFQIAYEIHKNRKHIYESKAIFNLAYVKAKKNDLKAALELYQEGQKVAARHNNQEVTEKLKLVKGLYLSFDLQTLREVFKFFKKKNLYGDMEEYAVAVADFLTNKEDRHDAVDFYQMAIEARKQIQRGKHLNEKM